MPFHSRKSPRLAGYDYTTENYYFITICTKDKQCIFGAPGQLNEFGRIAKEQIEKIISYYKGVSVDSYIIMPNHLHAIIVLNGTQKSISEIVGSYKAGVTREIRKTAPEMTVWQRSFHDHVIRNDAQYRKISEYVKYNDQKWADDCHYIACGQ